MVTLCSCWLQADCEFWVDVVFLQDAGELIFEEIDEDQGLQERFPSLAKRARRDSKIALSNGAELTVLTHIKPQVDRFVFPDGHLVFVLASGRLRILG